MAITDPGGRRVSIRKTLAFSFSAPVRQAGEILPRVVPLWIAGCLLLYGVLLLYFQQLLDFLTTPSDRIGSLVLGIVAGGTLLLLFLHSMISATIIGVLVRPGALPLLPRVRRRDWRLYAANLRILLLLGLVGAFYTAGHLLHPSSLLRMLLTAAALVLTALVILRVWFLAAPMSITHREGPVLRPSWRLSRGQAVPILILFCVLLLPGLAIEAVAEIVLRQSGLGSALAGQSLAALVVFYRDFLPVMLGVLAVIYLVTVLLMTGARVGVYRQLTDHTGP